MGLEELVYQLHVWSCGIWEDLTDCTMKLKCLQNSDLEHGSHLSNSLNSNHALLQDNLEQSLQGLFTSLFNPCLEFHCLVLGLVPPHRLASNSSSDILCCSGWGLGPGVWVRLKKCLNEKGFSSLPPRKLWTWEYYWILFFYVYGLLCKSKYFTRRRAFWIIPVDDVTDGFVNPPIICPTF